MQGEQGKMGGRTLGKEGMVGWQARYSAAREALRSRIPVER